MNEIYKTIIARSLMSFIGCLLALLVVGIVAGAVLFASIEGAGNFAMATLENRISEASVECSEEYARDSMMLTLNGETSYCKINTRPDINSFTVDFS